VKVPTSLILLCSAAAACTAAPPPGQQLAAAGAERCIQLDQVIARRASGPAAVDFEMLGGITYRNQLASACPGLERLGESAVVAVTAGAETGRLCAGDRVKIFDPVEVKATGLQTYPYCKLGEFTPTSTRPGP
jgi:hypothetical protein